jgi:hypothetical protein
MPDLFAMDDKDIKRLLKFYKKFPQKFQWATANILNDFGFVTRQAQIEAIQETMQVRNDRFLNSSMRVVKTRGSISVLSQKVIIGSRVRPRFSGWREQIEGGGKKRLSTVAARGGNFATTIRPRYRLKPQFKFPKPSQYPGRKYRDRLYAMLNILRRQKYKRPFMIPIGDSKLKSGLYRFAGKRLFRLQRFFRAPVHIRRIDWRMRGIEDFNHWRGTTTMKDLWIKSLRRVWGGRRKI